MKFQPLKGNDVHSTTSQNNTLTSEDFTEELLQAIPGYKQVPVHEKLNKLVRTVNPAPVKKTSVDVAKKTETHPSGKSKGPGMSKSTASVSKPRGLKELRNFSGAGSSDKAPAQNQHGISPMQQVLARMDSGSSRKRLGIEVPSVPTHGPKPAKPSPPRPYSKSFQRDQNVPVHPSTREQHTERNAGSVSTMQSPSKGRNIKVPVHQIVPHAPDTTVSHPMTLQQSGDPTRNSRGNEERRGGNEGHLDVGSLPFQDENPFTHFRRRKQRFVPFSIFEPTCAFMHDGVLCVTFHLSEGPLLHQISLDKNSF